MKKIIILKEHHSEVALDISTPEQLDKVALSIIKGRFNGLDYQEDEPPQAPDFKEEDIFTFPESLRNELLDRYDRYKKALRLYESEQRENQMIQTCIKTNDPKLAIKILKARSLLEDEGYRTLEVLDEYPQ